MAANRPQRAYEFPTGYNQLFGLERFLIGENFFVHSQGLVVSDIFSSSFCCVIFPHVFKLPIHQNSNPNIPRTLPALIAQSLSACEPDLRTILLSNVVLCGGGSLFAGLADRLHNELARNFPHVSFVFTIRVDEIRGII